MIDVGACVGDSFLPFFQKGWNIHAFEQNLENFNFLNKKFFDKNSWGNIIAIQDEGFFNIFTKLAKTYENFLSLNLYHYYRKHLL